MQLYLLLWASLAASLRAVTLRLGPRNAKPLAVAANTEISSLPVALNESLGEVYDPSVQRLMDFLEDEGPLNYYDPRLIYLSVKLITEVWKSEPGPAHRGDVSSSYVPGYKLQYVVWESNQCTCQQLGWTALAMLKSGLWRRPRTSQPKTVGLQPMFSYGRYDLKALARLEIMKLQGSGLEQSSTARNLSLDNTISTQQITPIDPNDNDDAASSANVNITSPTTHHSIKILRKWSPRTPMPPLVGLRLLTHIIETVFLSKPYNQALRYILPTGTVITVDEGVYRLALKVQDVSQEGQIARVQHVQKVLWDLYLSSETVGENPQGFGVSAYYSEELRRFPPDPFVSIWIGSRAAVDEQVRRSGGANSETIMLSGPASESLGNSTDIADATNSSIDLTNGGNSSSDFGSTLVPISQTS